MENFKIDEENRLYIFAHDDLKDSEKLKNESLELLKKSFAFDESAQLLLQKMNALALVVETEKLKALGEKSKLEQAPERKLKKTQELIQKINERKNHLENLQIEHQSLLKVEQEQLSMLEKIKNNKM